MGRKERRKGGRKEGREKGLEGRNGKEKGRKGWKEGRKGTKRYIYTYNIIYVHMYVYIKEGILRKLNKGWNMKEGIVKERM